MWKNRDTIPSAVTVFLVGQRITPLLSPWSTMTNKESKLLEGGRSVMRSQEIWWKKSRKDKGMGVRDGMVG